MAPQPGDLAKRGLSPGEQWALIQEGQRQYPGLPVERACQLLGMSRASYYREGRPVVADLEAPALREAIEQVTLEFPGYGYRRVTKHLQRAGWNVNHAGPT